MWHGRNMTVLFLELLNSFGASHPGFGGRLPFPAEILHVIPPYSPKTQG